MRSSEQEATGSAGVSATCSLFEQIGCRRACTPERLLILATDPRHAEPAFVPPNEQQMAHALAGSRAGEHAPVSVAA